jgi:hypothetical protein
MWEAPALTGRDFSPAVLSDGQRQGAEAEQS